MEREVKRKQQSNKNNTAAVTNAAATETVPGLQFFHVCGDNTRCAIYFSLSYIL